MRKHGGFTIIELMVIVAIIGILAAIAVPSLSESLARRRLEGVANELSADLQYTKSQATSVNTSVSLVTTAHGYTISNSASTFKTIDLDSKFTLSSPLTVTFEPYRDLPDTAFNITVAHTQTSAQLQVKVDVIGRIQMCSPSASLGGYVGC